MVRPEYLRLHVWYTATCEQAVIVLVMIVEVMVLLVRDERHLRVTRALRPILLLDTYLMAGVRRYM